MDLLLHFQMKRMIYFCISALKGILESHHYVHLFVVFISLSYYECVITLIKPSIWNFFKESPPRNPNMSQTLTLV